MVRGIRNKPKPKDVLHGKGQVNQFPPQAALIFWALQGVASMTCCCFGPENAGRYHTAKQTLLQWVPHHGCLFPLRWGFVQPKLPSGEVQLHSRNAFAPTAGAGTLLQLQERVN